MKKKENIILKTITIKKSDLWRYSTFLLIAVVIIGGIFMFTGNGSNSGAATGANTNSGSTGNVDLSIFDNPSLYPSLGPSNAEHTVIEFADFQCPFCGMSAGLASWVSQYENSQYSSLIGVSKDVENLARQGSIRFIYVPMSFLGQGSVYAAEAGYCALEQNKFWDMHDLIFKNQVPPAQEGTQFTKDQLEKLAATINGIDTGKFNDCLESDKYSSYVQKAASDASTAAQGTPTFYVDGTQVSPSKSVIMSALGQ